MSYGESLLARYLDAMVDVRYIRNHRPDWLKGLELDFYFPSKNIGVEFQGDHHYVATDYSKNLKAVKYRDWQKRKLCEANGTILIKIDAIDLEFTRLRHKFKKLKKWKRKALMRDLYPVLRAINTDATKYRRTLRASFDSPTTYRRKNPKRRLMIYGTTFKDSKQNSRDANVERFGQ